MRDDLLAIIGGGRPSILCRVDEKCVISIGDNTPLPHFAYRYLAHQMRVFLDYKLGAEKVELRCAPHCTSVMLEEQILNLTNWDGNLSHLYSESGSDFLASTWITFPDPDALGIVWSEDPQSPLDGKLFYSFIWVLF